MLLTRSYLLAVPLVFGCGEVGLNEIEPNTGLIEGSVLIQTSTNTTPCGSPVGGNVILSVFDATNPPPPSGSGGAVSFNVVPERAWRVGSGPLFTSEYSLPFLSAGTFLVSGFVDADGDFSPNVPLLAQPTAGDLAGGFVDARQEFIPISIQPSVRFDGVLVQMGRELPLEPPAFTPTASAIDAPTTTSSTLAINAIPLDRGPFRHRPECAGFIVQLVDNDRDGVPDDADMDGLPDLLPLVLLSQLSPSPGAEPVQVRARIDARPFQATLAAAGFAVVPSLTLEIPPAGFRRAEDGTIEPVGPLPPGPYSLSLFTGTSQRWTVPNEVDLVDPAGAPSAQSQPIILR